MKFWHLTVHSFLQLHQKTYENNSIFNQISYESKTQLLANKKTKMPNKTICENEANIVK